MVPYFHCEHRNNPHKESVLLHNILNVFDNDDGDTKYILLVKLKVSISNKINIYTPQNKILKKKKSYCLYNT